MADFPTTTELFAFAVFFVPGYLSLNVAAYLVKNRRLDLPWLETVVVSYVWSLLIFLPTFALVNLPLSATSVTGILSETTLILLLLFTVLFGFIAWLVYYVFLRTLNVIPRLTKNLGERFGLKDEEFSFDSTAVKFLELMWRTRVKNELIVETQSGRTFRGRLGSKSLEPSIEILITALPTLPMQELVSNKWVDLDEWSVLVPEGNIRSIRAIKSR
jgi:hypothetical protein